MKTWQSTIYQERGRRALALLANGLSLLTVNKIRQQWLCGEIVGLATTYLGLIEMIDSLVWGASRTGIPIARVYDRHKSSSPTLLLSLRSR